MSDTEQEQRSLDPKITTGFSHIQFLKNNQSFQYFIAECLEVKLREELTKSMASDTPKEDRENHIIRYQAFRDISEWFDEREITFRKSINKDDPILKQKERIGLQLKSIV